MYGRQKSASQASNITQFYPRGVNWSPDLSLEIKSARTIECLSAV
jgi:hypothetical protein